MYTHWLNGNLVLEPETGEERRALLVLWENAKQGPPPDQEGHVTSATCVLAEDFLDRVVTGHESAP